LEQILDKKKLVKMHNVNNSV